jgi:rhodanese-related sulfurtransferase
MLGKRYGAVVVRMVCRLSLESSACVRKTEGYFTRRGSAALLVAKFIPGLGAVAAPIAGQIGMDYGWFALCDAGGIVLWSLSVTLGGRIFGDVLKLHPNALSWTAHFFVVIFVLLFLGFLVWRMLQRRAFLRSVRMARVEPRELKHMIDSGQPVFIVDLRHPLDYLPDPRTLPGALSLTPDKLVEQSGRIPRDREVVLFCTCPSEATAARMALRLRGMGVHRVRPLRGGYDEWKRLGYPLVDIVAAPAA